MSSLFWKVPTLGKAPLLGCTDFVWWISASTSTSSVLVRELLTPCVIIYVIWKKQQLRLWKTPSQEEGVQEDTWAFSCRNKQEARAEAGQKGFSAVHLRQVGGWGWHRKHKHLAGAPRPEHLALEGREFRKHLLPREEIQIPSTPSITPRTLSHSPGIPQDEREGRRGATAPSRRPRLLITWWLHNRHRQFPLSVSQSRHTDVPLTCGWNRYIFLV